MGGKRHLGSNPTMDKAIAGADGDYASDELRRRQALREQADAARNARLRRLREQQADDPEGDGAA